MAAVFRLYRLRFHFVSAERVYYPRGKASNVIRGALGTILRGISCVPECAATRDCGIRGTCAYGRIFEPVGWDGGPSGLQDPPRPFVLRAAHLDGATVEPGQPFSFDLHLFLTTNPPLEGLVLAFLRLAETGLGPSRGRVRLEAVDLVGSAPGDALYARIFEQGRFVSPELAAPLEIPLSGALGQATTLRVRFVTPMELKQKGRIAQRPEFALLVTRIAERLSNLCAMYGERPLEWDWRGLMERAREISLAEWRFEQVEPVERFSTRTGQSHGMGGFVGVADYQGAGIGAYLPVLEAGRYCGVGRHTVWGNGMIEVSAL